MRELDELLTRYLDQQYSGAPPAQQSAFRDLLESPDPLIYAYFLGRQEPSDPTLSLVLKRITAAATNHRY
jgi:succinate dehydrogenase flavin-adding protein (antitoxin of CptAB toxin-antitoxin module)